MTDQTPHTTPADLTHVATLAAEWAANDPLEQWVNAAPTGGPTPIAETIAEYLAGHDPFPDESRVDVLRRDGTGWEPATIVERCGIDEWVVEFDDGEQVFRDHTELRPHVTAAET